MSIRWSDSIENLTHLPVATDGIDEWPERLLEPLLHLVEGQSKKLQVLPLRRVTSLVENEASDAVVDDGLSLAVSGTDSLVAQYDKPTVSASFW